MKTLLSFTFLILFLSCSQLQEKISEKKDTDKNITGTVSAPPTQAGPMNYKAVVGDIEIYPITILMAPPGASNTAGYMIIKNNGDKPLKITGFSSELAKANELHDMKNEDGVMKMTPVKTVEIPAKGQAEFKSGGYHLMLIGLKRQIEVGEIHNLTLFFDDGSAIKLPAVVQPIQ